jgi:hypothetical protein
VTWENTILTQYSASTRLLNIIDTFNQAVSLDDFTDEFIKRVWDLTTNETYGLDVWGKYCWYQPICYSTIDSDSFGYAEADDGAPVIHYLLTIHLFMLAFRKQHQFG